MDQSNHQLRLFLAGIFALACLSIAASFYQFHTVYFITKPATTILIIMMMVFCQSGERAFSSRHKLLGLALIFCLIGDTVLLKESLFVYGLAAFLIAHLIFAVLFARLANSRNHFSILIVLVIIGSVYYLFLLPNLNTLAFPVAIYTSCIVIMCWYGIRAGLNSTNQERGLLVIAPVLFLISDAILAFNKFYFAFELSALLILSTYWLSITLITLAVCMDRNTLKDHQL